MAQMPEKTTGMSFKSRSKEIRENKLGQEKLCFTS